MTREKGLHEICFDCICVHIKEFRELSRQVLCQERFGRQLSKAFAKGRKHDDDDDDDVSRCVRLTLMNLFATCEANGQFTACGTRDLFTRQQIKFRKTEAEVASA